MDLALLIIVKVSKCKLRPFEHTQSMSIWPVRSVNIGNIINYLLYLPGLFPRGLDVDLEGINTFLTLIL